MNKLSLKWSVVAVVLLVGGAYVFDHARWYVFQTRLSNALQGMPKQPSIVELTGLRGRLEREASSLLISSASLELDIRVEQHDSNGRALREDSSKQFWFVIVDARHGKKTATWERRIDQDLAEAEWTPLEKGRVRVVRPKVAGGAR